jgi:hypothetical protein
MRNTKRNQTRKTHRRKAINAVSIKRKRVTKRTMKGGVIGNNVSPNTWRRQLKEVNKTNKAPNSMNSNKPKAPWNMSKLSGTLNLDILAQNYPNNTICKDTVNNFWELRYFTTDADESQIYNIITEKLSGLTIFASKLDTLCLNSPTEYYRRLVNSGLVTFITANPNYNPKPEANSKKYLLTPRKIQNPEANAQKLYVYSVINPLTITSDKPNTGAKQLEFQAKDDARGVRVVRVSDIATGKYAMPFLHVYFLRDYYSKCPNPDESIKRLVEQLHVVYDLSRIRNHRIMKLINAKLDKLNGFSNNASKYHKFNYTFNDAPNLEQVKQSATALGVDVNKYLSESMDAEEVEGCSNNWNLDQKPPGTSSASDNVPIITDLNGEDWLILIIRGNAPGINNLAWAGGFVDPGETFDIAAIRELAEEVGGASNLKTQAGGDVNIEKATLTLDKVAIPDWDPRIKFYGGMTVGAVVHHYYFFPKNANGGNNKSMRKYKCKAPTQ